ncbi:hypothetical protein J4220_00040 [Candidatus Micrarchaeota archaeon]|nr:hypothetical protein [Candidatus Micrarchaeota archaeon]
MTSTQTHFGRNWNVMEKLGSEFRGKEHVVAWVVGIGMQEKRFGPYAQAEELSKNFEHVELAEVLRKAGVKKYKVYASDIEEKAISAAKRDLERGKLVVERSDLESRSEYGRRFFRLKAGSGGGVSCKLPKKTVDSIVLLGPGAGGNALLEKPGEKAHVILYLNGGYHLKDDEQKELSGVFAEAAETGGMVVTETRFFEEEHDNIALSNELEKLFGKPEIHDNNAYYRKSRWPAGHE